MKKTLTWIILLDKGRARAVEHDGHRLAVVPDITFDGLGKEARDIEADRPGRTHDSHGPGRHAMEPHTNPKDVEAKAFVGLVADKLAAAQAQGRFDRLVLAAAPEALGLLRDALSAPVKERVIGELDKDLTKTPVADLGPHLDGILIV